MTVELLTTSGNKARLRVAFSAEEVSEHFDKVLNSIAKRTIIPGFRKGKAPKTLILSRISQEELAERARSKMREQSVAEAIEKFHLELRKPMVDFLDDRLPVNGQDFTFELEIPLMPKVTLPDYRDFKITLKRIAVTPQMKEDYKKRLRERFTKFVEKPGKLEMGDALVYDLETYYSDSGEPAPLKQEDIHYITGREDNLTGYDENLLGIEAQEVREFEYMMPEDFFLTEVAGKRLKFRVRAKKVEQVVVPDIDADFVREHFKMEDMREFDNYLEETLKAEIEREEERQKGLIALEQVAQRMEAHISEDLVKEEIDFLVAAKDRELRRQGISLEEALERENKNLGTFREELRPMALQRIRELLAVREIAKAEKISIENDELARYASFLARRHNLARAQMQKLLKNEDMLESMRIDILREKVKEHLRKSINFCYEEEAEK